MKYDAFSKCHPAVNFLFFLGAIGCGVVIQHPAYLLAGAVCAGSYYLLLNGKKGIKALLAMLPFCLLLTALNPLFNTQGSRVLFYLFGRPYTFEALLYGGAIAGVLLVMLLWFGCYNKVLTSDKFTSLFGNLIPSLSLLLVMVFRMVPGLIRKTQQMIGARRSIGKGAGEAAGSKEKLLDGMTVLGAMTSWALEGSVVTGDSMRGRGYGVARRTNFQIYRITARDCLLLALMAGLLAVFIVFAAFGAVEAVFTPALSIAPLSGTNLICFAAYCVYLLLPTILHTKEAIQWHILRSKI